MGPRPPRPGVATLASRPAPIVEVVRRRGPRPPEPPTAPLPPVVISALAAIVRDMRDVPRGYVNDPAELLFWLRRMANRVEGVGRMRVVGTERSVFSAGRAAGGPAEIPARSASPRDLAEAVFGKGSYVGTLPTDLDRGPSPRTIVSRRGHAVRVEVRRARAAGQMELSL